MAEEAPTEAPVSAGRFRLPKLFADQGEAAIAPGETATEVSGGGTAAPSLPESNGSAAPSGPPASPAALIIDELKQVSDGMELVFRLLSDINERETAQEKVFDTLYSELREYKNDFIYEHLKPVVRPLLFLFDSFEQFEREVQAQERPAGEERRGGMSPTLVRENLFYFREQLVEALRICEVTMMEAPQGEFNAKLHKAVEVVEVEAEANNTVQRVVRSGWYLNGQLLRPAEVAVGKAK